MADSLVRVHSNSWVGWVEKEPLLNGRFIAAAAPAGRSRSGSDHATAELAQHASDIAVWQTGHRCSALCEPWHRG
jgi:hypothetical protein